MPQAQIHPGPSNLKIPQRQKRFSSMSKQKVGLWLIGGGGGVGSTAALGLAALARNLTDTTSLVTELPMFQGLDLPTAGDFVVGGHEIRKATLWDAVNEMHERANVFTHKLLAGCESQLAEWQKNFRPGTVIASGSTIEKLADRPEVFAAESPRAATDRIKADLEDFRNRHQLDRVVVAHVASTEPPFELGAEHQSWPALEAALKGGGRKDLLPASSLYALAAVEMGLAYVNFTPSTGASIPALLELAEKTGSVVSGKDGKTGETLMKTVLAPMFAHRNWKILSWVGHNIFGNRDGVVLDDPANKAAKVRDKDAVIPNIVGYKPNTLVSIEYIPSMDDWKTAWNHIHFQGFLGTKMILQFIWQGCDSLLAAPLVIDLVRLSILAQSRGEKGVLSQLACFYKAPMGTRVNDFFIQFDTLKNYLESCRAK